jgi:hypothetical protein
LFVDNRELIRVFFDSFQEDVHDSDEPYTQSITLVLVPGSSVVSVDLSLTQ